MRIGILSDTHNYLPTAVKEIFKGVEYIFHAGDIGSMEVIKELGMIAPVHAVYGNIDGNEVRRQFPATIFSRLHGRDFCLVHDIGSIRDFSFKLFKSSKTADIVIHGHTHIFSYQEYQKKIFINPGSTTLPKFENKGSVIVADFDREIFNYQCININKY